MTITSMSGWPSAERRNRRLRDAPRRGRIEDRQIRVLINLANLYSQRQSFIKALEYVNRALLVDENSQMANDARNRIELAMNAGRGGRGFR